MRVLVAHNYYRSAIPSGENRVVDLEIGALRAAGHDVVTYLRSSDEIPGMAPAEKVRAAVSPVSSPRAAADVRHLLAESPVDVMHLHNPYPLISLDVVRAARAAGVPVVQTVHNHRHTCMKGTYQREGHDCRDCLTHRSPWPGVHHACYRDSRAQSAVMAAALLRHRSTYQLIDRFIALTPEIEASLLASGFPASRITIKPNSVPDPGPASSLGEGFAFVGRLSEEKGVLALIEAWSRFEPGSLGRLRIAGDGPARDEVDRLAASRPDIDVLGRVEPDAVADLLATSAALAVPSLWAEALPLVVLEALAAGRALLVTDMGGLPGVVDDEVGLVVPPSVDGLADGLVALARDREGLTRRGAAARARYLTRYHPSVVTESLVAVYTAARNERS
ncbi:glycosyltransferase family 4 protein [Motilibacter aurantiacus]|uniref:glycosyltransferase family 4 protein n=1 Tax=Motilibacter aurantiacus TaxID=2714955 RepID=UPI0014082107|nr:glycosyltransferase family 4 protein [Motilibacter aurantiacus]NHC46352.1 glycosyltransferase family 4 protein [Motilibacter aurantiacus]